MAGKRKRKDRKVLFLFGGETILGRIDRTIPATRKGYTVVCRGRVAHEITKDRIVKVI